MQTVWSVFQTYISFPIFFSKICTSLINLGYQLKIDTYNILILYFVYDILVHIADIFYNVVEICCFIFLA